MVWKVIDFYQSEGNNKYLRYVHKGLEHFFHKRFEQNIIDKLKGLYYLYNAKVH